jgi:hypothetical protein
MVKSEKKRNTVWLQLRGYHMLALKPDLAEHMAELERAIHKGIPAYPDPSRADFYDVPLEEGWAYVHVYRDGHAVYLVAYSGSDAEGLPCYFETFNPANLPFYKKLGFRIEGAGRIPGGPSFWAMARAPEMQSKAG